MNLRRIDIMAIERAVRAQYLALYEDGVLHVEMAEETGLPPSFFSMWLSGKREMKKLAQLDACLKALPSLRRMRWRRVG